jgi:uncharacterized protein (TIGR02646 family)
MVFIDKNKKPSSIETANDLHHWRDNHVFKYENGFSFKQERRKLDDNAFSIWFEKHKSRFKEIEGKKFEEVSTNINADIAWQLIFEFGDNLKNKIREALFEEQEKICCYCIQQIELDKTAIEHFLAKSVKLDNVFENMYNYYNLLLSCDGNGGESELKNIYQIFKKGNESWDNVVNNLRERHENEGDFVINVNLLKTMNPNQADNERPKGQLIYRYQPNHCDSYKKDKTDEIINPTLGECWDRFNYNKNGIVKGNDRDAVKTIAVLNLNAKILVEKRAKKWEEFESIFFTEDLNVSEYLDNKNLFGLKTYIEKELEKEVKGISYPFCTVKRAFLKQEFEKILV